MNFDKLTDLRGRFDNHLNLPREAMVEMFDFVEAAITACKETSVELQKPKRVSKVVEA